MPNHDNTNLLGLWLDGKLSEQQRQEFEQRCIEDDAFASQVEAANMVAMQAEQYQSASVPDWNRSATFEAQQNAYWWQWQGLSSLSFASSMLAIVMVLSGMQVRVDDGALTVSFADKSSQQIEQLVNNKLAEFQQNQQLALVNYGQALQQQQLETSTQLTNYLLTSSRKERKEDFAELINFVNQQRGDDQLFYARQLNKLQQTIYDEPNNAGRLSVPDANSVN
jgi:hypothetical protein